MGFQAQTPELYGAIDTQSIVPIEESERAHCSNSTRSVSPNDFETNIDLTQSILNQNQPIMPDTDTESRNWTLNFMNLCARSINQTFSGDQLDLTPFLNSIKLIEPMASTEELKTILKSFLLSKLRGVALDCMPTEPDSVKDITDALKKAIKTKSSTVVEGKMLALKADKTNFSDYAKRAETLAESFKRSLILEGIPSDKANEMTIKKTVELCRSNTKSSVVRSILGSSAFETSKDVITKFIVESRTDTSEQQVLSFKSQHQNNAHNNNNQQKGW